MPEVKSKRIRLFSLTSIKSRAKPMYRQLCSLCVVQRRVNDGVRSSAASFAAASLIGEGAEFVRGEAPSHKLTGPKYVIVAPDPCEDPERIYVDVVIKKTQDSRHLTEEWEKMVLELKKLGPWASGTYTTSSPDLALDEKHRQAAMDRLTFISRLDPAAVDLPEWQESNAEFARRLTLRHLCTIILESGALVSKENLFNEIFEKPPEVATAGNITGMANRGRFTQESLVEWFFTFDTYSKCIIFYEAVARYLDAQASPVNLSLDDIYCDVYSQILRQTYLTRVDNTVSPERSLAPTSDIKLLPVSECVRNFITSAVEVTFFSHTRREYKIATGALKLNGPGCPSANRPVPPGAETKMESIKRLLKQDQNEEAVSSDGEYEEGDATVETRVKRKAAPYRGSFNNKLQRTGNNNKKDSNIEAHSIIEGYMSGHISPLTLYLRNEPLVPSAHNHLLFPVFADERPGAEILFFMHPKIETAASLLLPGLFRNKKQYLCGNCKWMNMEGKTPTSRVSSAAGSKDTKETWRYSLADYCPLRYCTGEISLQLEKSGGGTSTLSSKHLDVQPLYF